MRPNLLKPITFHDKGYQDQGQGQGYGLGLGSG